MIIEQIAVVEKYCALAYLLQWGPGKDSPQALAKIKSAAATIAGGHDHHGWLFLSAVLLLLCANLVPDF